MMKREGELISAAQLLREAVSIAGSLPDTISHLARAYLYLANVESTLSKSTAVVSELRETNMYASQSMVGKGRTATMMRAS